jgi:hypothetical protein
MPLWLIFFVLAGFLLFAFKVSGERHNEYIFPKVRLFLLLAVLLFAVAGMADFVKWVRAE